MLVEARADHAGAARQRRSRAQARRARARSSARSWSSSARSRRARSSRATSGCRSRRRSTTCSPGPQGTFNFEAGRPARAAGLPGLDQPRVAAARGRAAGGRVEPDREEDPVLRPHLRRSIASALGDQRRHAHGRAAARRCRCSTARATCTQVIEESGLGEFEVGKALYGLITAGFAASGRPDRRGGAPKVERRAGRGAPQPRRRVLQDRRCSTRRGASSAGWPSCGAADANAPFFLGLVALRRRAGARRWSRCGSPRRRAAPAGGAAQPGVRLEQLGRLDEAEAAYAEAASRARTTRASCSAGASWR